jgi:fatty acid-binding protein DegV
MKTLAKSGRVSNIIATIGGLMNIKPIIFLNEEGKFQTRQKVIGRKNALNKMIEHFKQNYNFESDLVYILHGDKVQDAELLQIHHENIH